MNGKSAAYHAWTQITTSRPDYYYSTSPNGQTYSILEQDYNIEEQICTVYHSWTQSTTSRPNHFYSTSPNGQTYI